MKPLRHRLNRFQRIVGLHGFSVQIYTALHRFQRNPRTTVSLQIDDSVVFNFAIQYTGGHIDVGRRIRLHLVGHAGYRMMQTVHVRICRNGYVTVCSRCFEYCSRRQGYIGRVAVFHHPDAGSGCNILLDIFEGIFQPLQTAAGLNARPAELVFNGFCDYIGIGISLNEQFNIVGIAHVRAVAFSEAVCRCNMHISHFVFGLHVNGLRLYGTLQVYVGSRIVINDRNRSGKEGFIRRGHRSLYVHVRDGMRFSREFSPGGNFAVFSLRIYFILDVNLSQIVSGSPGHSQINLIRRISIVLGKRFRPGLCIRKTLCLRIKRYVPSGRRKITFHIYDRFVIGADHNRRTDRKGCGGSLPLLAGCSAAQHNLYVGIGPKGRIPDRTDASGIGQFNGSRIVFYRPVCGDIKAQIVQKVLRNGAGIKELIDQVPGGVIKCGLGVGRNIHLSVRLNLTGHVHLSRVVSIGNGIIRLAGDWVFGVFADSLGPKNDVASGCILNHGQRNIHIVCKLNLGVFCIDQSFKTDFII